MSKTPATDLDTVTASKTKPAAQANVSQVNISTYGNQSNPQSDKAIVAKEAEKKIRKKLNIQDGFRRKREEQIREEMEKQDLVESRKKEEGLPHEMERQENFMQNEFAAEEMNLDKEECRENKAGKQKALKLMKLAAATLATSSASAEKHIIRKVDRISSLPCDVLCHILSFLPSQCSISTSLLSRNWRNLWKYVPTVIIDYKQEWGNQHAHFNGHRVSPTENHHSFVNLANHLLLLRDDNVRSIRLHSEVLMDLSYFEYWIQAAIQRQVCELDISLCQAIPWDPLLSLCSCETLEVLKLCGYVDVHKAPMFSLHHHHLKALHLGKMELTTMELIYRGCPNLEELFLDFELESSYKKSYIISVPTLKRLSIRCRSMHLQMGTELPDKYEADFHCEFLIGSPNLESLHIVGPELVYNTVKLPFRKGTVDREPSYYFKRSTCLVELLDARADRESPSFSVGLHMTTKIALILTGPFVQ